MGTRKSNRKSTKNKKRFRKTRSKRGGGQFLSQPSPPHVCPICTEDINENCITTSCGHHFDKDCLKEWCNARRGSPTCPICRAPIDRICRELLFTDLEKLLFDAIKAGEIDFIERALALGLNPDGSIQYDYNNIPRLNIDVIDKNGNTPLIIAARNNQDEIVDLLLRQGADMEHLNDDNKDAYQIAIENGSTDVENKLLEHGYYDHAEDAIEFLSTQHNTGVSRGGKRRTRSKRQRGGAPSSKKRKREEEPIDIALMNEKDSDGRTALYKASWNGEIELVARLLAAGADVEAKDNDGFTALIRASGKGHTEIVEMLLDKGAKVNAKDNNFDSSALINTIYNGHIETARMLIDKGADVNVKDKDGDTALMLASYYGELEIMKMLLDKGADVNAKNKDGNTALIEASSRRYIEIVKMLLATKGIKVNARNIDGYTAVDAAGNNQDIELIKLLIIAGATIPEYREDLLDIKEEIIQKKLMAPLVTYKGRKTEGGPRLLSYGPTDIGRHTSKFLGLGGKRKARKSKKLKRKHH